MLVNETLTLGDLHERMPDPPKTLFVGSPPLLHHAFGFGETVLVSKAVAECLRIATKRGDKAAIAHLRAHIDELNAYKKGRDEHVALAQSPSTTTR